jgi:hypothetical protein
MQACIVNMLAGENMNRLTIEKRVQVISALVEGSSLRSTVRMTGVALNTIQKLLAELGIACM